LNIQFTSIYTTRC